MKNEVKIFVYASCHYSEHIAYNINGGNGAYGVVININGQRVAELSEGFSKTNNVRMDIMGITEGLKSLTEHGEIIVYSSNGCIDDALNKGWLKNWTTRKKGFDGIKHADLWIELNKVLMLKQQQVVFKHSDDEVKSSKDFQRAEFLAKSKSRLKNQKQDLNPEQPST